MKLICLSLILIFMSSLSCDKEEYCYLDRCDEYWEGFQSTATLNNEDTWIGNKCWFGDLNNGTTVIHLDYTNPFNELREGIRIRDFKLSEGKITLVYQWSGSDPNERSPTSFFDTFVADGDASTESYDLNDKEGFDNYLIIDSISNDGIEIFGKYQLYFVLSKDSPSKFDESRPDTLIFTDGVFKARTSE